MTGRVFTKLLFSFILVLCIGTAVLDFSLRHIVEHSLYRGRAEFSSRQGPAARRSAPFRRPYDASRSPPAARALQRVRRWPSSIPKGRFLLPPIRLRTWRTRPTAPKCSQSLSISRSDAPSTTAASTLRFRPGTSSWCSPTRSMTSVPRCMCCAATCCSPRCSRCYWRR